MTLTLLLQTVFYYKKTVRSNAVCLIFSYRKAATDLLELPMLPLNDTNTITYAFKSLVNVLCLGFFLNVIIDGGV